MSEPAHRQLTASHRSSEELWQSTLVHVIARVLFWDGCCLSLRSCSPHTVLPLPRASAPCLALWAAAPVEASLSLLLRGLCSFTRVASLVLLVTQHFSFCDHARARSGVEHTSAVSTVTVRDSCDQPLSSPRSTSSRCPFITGSSCSSSSLGCFCPSLHEI